MNTVICSGRPILTMTPNCPSVRHVAVRDGRIPGAGSLEDARAEPTGALQEMAARHVAFRAAGVPLAAAPDEPAACLFAHHLCHGGDLP